MCFGTRSQLHVRAVLPLVFLLLLLFTFSLVSATNSSVNDSTNSSNTSFFQQNVSLNSSQLLLFNSTNVTLPVNQTSSNNETNTTLPETNQTNTTNQTNQSNTSLPVTVILPEDNSTNVSLPVFNETNSTLSNETNTTVLNETNVTLSNSTNNTNVTVQSMPLGDIVIGKPVRWQTVITYENATNETNITLPRNARNLVLRKTGKEDNTPLQTEHLRIHADKQDMSLERYELEREYDDLQRNPNANEERKYIVELQRRVKRVNELGVSAAGDLSVEKTDTKITIDEPVQELTVTYTTEAPLLLEEEKPTGKKILVTSETEGYENILAFTTVPNVLPNAIHLYRTTDGVREETPLTKKDTDDDGLIDYIEWIVPHLSNQTYDLELVVLNPVTYLRDGDTWIVRFNTTGTGNLSIVSPNAAFEEVRADSNLTTDELRFVDLRCGDDSVTSYAVDALGFPYNYSSLAENSSIKPAAWFVPDYSCDDQTSEFETVVNIAGYAVLNFTFADVSGVVSDVAVDPTGITECGNLTTPNEVYTLLNDLSTSGSCLEIQADNVTIDGAGYIISYAIGNGTPYLTGIYSDGYDNITIRNIRLTASQYNDYSISVKNGNNASISNVTMNLTGVQVHGIELVGMQDSVIDGFIASSTAASFSHLILISSSDRAIVQNSILNSSGFTPIRYDSSEDSTFSNVSFNGPVTALMFGALGSVADTNHTFINVTRNGEPLYYYHGVNDVVLTNMSGVGEAIFADCNNVTLRDESYSISRIGVFYCTNFTVLNSSVDFNGSSYQSGLFAYLSDNLSVINSTIQTLGGGIKAQSSNGVTISGNVVNQSAHVQFDDMVLLIASSGGYIGYNNITSFGFKDQPLHLNGVDDSLIEHNILSSSASEVHVLWIDGTSMNNTVQWNTINASGSSGDTLSLNTNAQSNIVHDNQLFATGGALSYGMRIYGDSNSFYNNTLNTSVSSAYHVSLEAGADNNVFYGNNFTGVGLWASDSGTGTQFNTSVGGIPQGNYYPNITDYDVYDSDADGWADTGVQYPLSATTVSAKWTGSGADYGPATTATPLQCGELNSPNTIYEMQDDLSSTGTCFNITAENVTLDCNGYTITHGTTGLANAHGIILTRNFATIRNVNIVEGSTSGGTKRGLDLEYANDTIVINVSVTGSIVYVIGSDRGYFRNVSVAGAGSYTAFELTTGSDNVTIIGSNISSSTRNAFKVVTSTNASVYDSSFYTNSPVSYDVIALTSSSYINLVNNTLTAERVSNRRHLLSISNTAYNYLRNNTFVSAGDDVLYVGGSVSAHWTQDIDESNLANGLPIEYYDNVARTCPDNSVLSFNPAVQNISALFLRTCNNITISGLNLSGLGYIHASYSQDIAINNFIAEDNLYGIFSYGSNNISVTNASIITNTSSSNSLQLFGGDYHIVQDSYFSSSGYQAAPGAFIAVNYNTVTGNTFVSVSSDAVPTYLSSASTNNVFTNNTFIGSADALEIVLTAGTGKNNVFTGGSAQSTTGSAILFTTATVNNNFTNMLLNSSDTHIELQAPVQNQLFYNNSLVGSGVWVDDLGTNNQFNTTINGVAVGNVYPNITSYAIYDGDQDGYGDTGPDYPLNASSAPGVWVGYGADYGPHTTLPIPLTSCQNITESGYYEMQNNVTSSGTCLEVRVDDVSIAGENFFLIGSNSSGSFGITTNASNTSVHDLTILWFGNDTSTSGGGMLFNGSENSSVSSVNITVYRGSGITLLDSNNASLSTLNISTTNTVGSFVLHYGIFMNASDGIAVTNSTITTVSEGSSDVYLTDSSGVTIANNNLSTTGRHSDGITASNTPNATFEGNIITTSDVAGIGIEVLLGDDSTIDNNTITVTGSDTRYTFGMILGGHLLVTNNIVTTTQVHGIFTTNAHNSVFENNTVVVSSPGTIAMIFGDTRSLTLRGNNLTIPGSSVGIKDTATAGLAYHQYDIDESNIINGLPIEWYDGIARACPDNSILTFNPSVQNISHLHLVGCQNVTITGLNLTGFDFVQLYDSTNITVIDYEAMDNFYGFFVRGGGDNALINSSIDTGGAAAAYVVYLSASSFNTIIGNTFTSDVGEGYPVYLDGGSAFNLIEANIMNTTGAYSGIRFAFGGSSNNTVRSNYITTAAGDAPGILIWNTNGNLVENNTITPLTAPAVQLLGGLDNRISNNTLSSSYRVIDLAPGDSTVIDGNLLNASASGTHIVLTTSAISSSIYNNTFIGSGVWVNNSNETNSFNLSGVGNTYLDADAYDLYDNNVDGYADFGADYPLNATSAPTKWDGFGADYAPASTPVSIKEGSSTASLSISDKSLDSLQAGQEFSFLHNVTITNLGNSDLFNISIINTTLSAYISNLTVFDDNCTTLSRNNTCYKTYNFTIVADPPIGTVLGAVFEANWTNANGTNDSVNNSFNLIILDNPEITLNQTSISLNTSLGSTTAIPVRIDNTGNVRLGESASAVNSVFVDTAGISSSWVTYSSPNTQWNDADCGANDCLDFVNAGNGADLTISVLPTDFTPGVYTGYINISAFRLGALQTYEIINVTINMTTALSLNVTELNFTQGLSTIQNQSVSVSASGNAPITGVNATYTAGTLPSGWISFASTHSSWNGTQFSRINETTTAGLDVVILPTDFTPGNYSGTITFSPKEVSAQNITVRAEINPQLTVANTTYSLHHGTTTNNSFYVNSTGNAQLTNVTFAFANQSMPASWITFTYAGQTNASTLTIGNVTEQSVANITATVTIPEFQDPGNYAGIITVTPQNKPAQNITLTVAVTTNSSWHLVDPINQSHNFTLNNGGAIGSVVINNTGNVPLNFSLVYDTTVNYGGDICNDYFCLGNPPTLNNPATIYVAKNSTTSFAVTTIPWAETKSDVGVKVTLTNTSATPTTTTANFTFNIFNQPPLLVLLQALPTNYTEYNTTTTLNAIISDDEDNTSTKGLNITSVYFTITTPSNITYQYNKSSITVWDDNDEDGAEADRKKFNLTFNITNETGNYTFSVFIQDKSNNSIEINNATLAVIAATTINTTGAATNVTGITQQNSDTTIATITLNNTGLVTAYNITLSALFGTAGWSANVSSAGTLTSGQTTQTNLTLSIPAATSPGSYSATPYANWTQADGSSNAQNGSSFTVVVSSNPQVTTLSSYNQTIAHNTNTSFTFQTNSTGNAQYQNAIIAYTNTTIPAGWVSFVQGFDTRQTALGNLPINSSTNTTVYVSIPKGASPGTYVGYFNVSGTTYSASRSQITNLTITVPLDANSWNYSVSSITTDFDLNDPGVFANVTLSNDGNGPLSFTFTYQNASDTDYNSYPSLFIEDNNVSGTIMNPTNYTLNPASTTSLLLYQAGWTQGLTNVGVTMTLNDSVANTANTTFVFNITDAPPEIAIVADAILEVNKNATIQIVTTDDSGLNISTVLLNVTLPNASSQIISVFNTSENVTLNGNYTEMNFTATYNPPLAGAYVFSAIIDDIASQQSSTQANATAVGTTTLSVQGNESSFTANNIFLLTGENLSLGLNISNTGSVGAYNISASGLVNGTVWNVSGAAVSSLSAAQTTTSPVTIVVPANTSPGNYSLIPQLSWINPDGTLSSVNDSAILVVVASNKVVSFATINDSFSLEHGVTNNQTVIVQSTGNDVASNINVYITTTPDNFTVAPNQTSLGNLTPGQTAQFALAITPALGTLPSAYQSVVKLRNDALPDYSDNKTINITVPINTTWVVSPQTLTVHGVSQQNLVNQNITITSLANQPINLSYTLTGQVIDLGIMNLLDTSESLDPLETAVIRLNHTSLVTNADFTGTVTIDDGTPPLVDVNITYDSHIANVSLENISPFSEVLFGDTLSLTTRTIFETANVTSNLTFAVTVNGTTCPITTQSVSTSFVLLNCTAPNALDATNHDVTVYANYSSAVGLIELYSTSSGAVGYKDITAPVVSSITADDTLLSENLTLNASVTDNGVLDTVYAVITDEDGVDTNVTLSLSAGTYVGSINTSALSGVGQYTVTVLANDTAGNINDSESTSTIVYLSTAFAGQILTLLSEPVNVSFDLVGTQNYSFSTNTSGHYAQTLDAKIYDTAISLNSWEMNLSSVEWMNLPSDFIDIDLFNGSEVAADLVGSKQGFAVLTDLNGTGDVSFDYNQLSVTAEDNLRVYQCLDWNYATRNCSGVWWQQLPHAIDKVNNVVYATLSNGFSDGSSAFMLAELPATGTQVMNIPDASFNITVSHGNTTNGTLQVQSIGTSQLQSVQAECYTGTVCTQFTVESDIIGVIPIGQGKYVTLSVTVPQYTLPGTYSGSIRVSSTETYKVIPIYVTVPESSTFNASLSPSTIIVGSGVSGTLGTLSIVNTGNIAHTVNISSANMTVSKSETELALQGSDTASVSYTAPSEEGVYNYTVAVNQQNSTAIVNVTSAVHIINVSPASNISAGDTITLLANATSLTVLQTANVTWTATIGGVSCPINTSSYAGNWTITCTAPTVVDYTNQTLILDGSFQSGHALATDTVVYTDVYAPLLTTHDDSAEFTTNLTLVNASILDDSPIQSVSVVITSPSATISNGTVTFTNTSVQTSANLTELGDYTFTYTLTDNRNNSQTVSEYFEVYEEEVFSGNVLKGDGTAAQATISLYRRAGETPLVFSTDGAGQYSAAIKNRTYRYLTIDAYDTLITLDNVNLLSYTDPFDLEAVNVSRIAIANTGAEIMGIAVNTTINTTGTVRFNYDPADVTNPADLKVFRCGNWSHPSHSCDQVYWTFISSTLGVNYVEFNISGFSAYVLAESATASFVVGDGICSLEAGENHAVSSDDCPDSGSSVTNVYNTGGGGGGGGGTSSVTTNYNTITQAEDPLSILTPTILRDLYQGEKAESRVLIQNKANVTKTLSFSVSDDIADYVSLETSSLTLQPNETGDITLLFDIPLTLDPKTIYGHIVVYDGTETYNVPVEIRVFKSYNNEPTIRISTITPKISPGDPLRVQVVIAQPSRKEMNFTLLLELVHTKRNSVVLSQSYDLSLHENYVDVYELLSDDALETGDYFVRATLRWQEQGAEKELYTSEPVQVVVPLGARIEYALSYKVGFFSVRLLLVLLVIAVLLVLTQRVVHQYQERTKKYHVPVNARKLPGPGKRSAYLGHLAETDMRTFFELEKLTTHTLIAGSTGGGKTVAAQVLIEEALQKGIGVAVFDPTAQWSGFLRKNTDKDMFSLYNSFGLSQRNATAFPGSVRIVRNAREKIDLSQTIKPGEITVFALHKMNLKDIDLFVANTVKQVFGSGFDESKELKMLLVYDEVHRLLPKFGGNGVGFLQIERACREFRKWGIGLVLISQVLGDFKGQIKANINTEIQLRTKDEADLERVTSRYGEPLQQALIRASVGTGMVQNSEYNKGQPYLIAFRPLLHDPHRLSEKELDLYDAYDDRLRTVAYHISVLKDSGVDTFDLEVELKLSIEKLRKGEFTIVDIYLEGLEPRIKALFAAQKKKLPSRPVDLISDEEIKEELELAKREREEFESDKAKPSAAPIAAPAVAKSVASKSAEQKTASEKKQADSAEKEEPVASSKPVSVSPSPQLAPKDVPTSGDDIASLSARLSALSSRASATKVSPVVKLQLVSLEGDLRLLKQDNSEERRMKIIKKLNEVEEKIGV